MHTECSTTGNFQAIYSIRWSSSQRSFRIPKTLYLSLKVDRKFEVILMYSNVRPFSQSNKWQLIWFCEVTQWNRHEELFTCIIDSKFDQSIALNRKRKDFLPYTLFVTLVAYGNFSPVIYVLIFQQIKILARYCQIFLSIYSWLRDFSIKQTFLKNNTVTVTNNNFFLIVKYDS